jgi:sortase A
MNGATLRWIERILIAVGLVLGVWAAAILVESRFVQTLIVRPRSTAPVATLPGDAGTTTTSSKPARPRPAPAVGSLLGKLVAPSVHLTATILEGTDDGTLSRGAGHIEDTPFPGEPGNIGIAGHRDTTFRAVRNLRLGDELDVVTADRTFHYQITKTFVVEPEDVYVLDPGKFSMLTLVTCYPFEYIGHAPHRYIVQAMLVDAAAP